MIALAFLGYLFVFYVLPWHRTVLYQWVWGTAPTHLPYLMVHGGGHILFNGAFYATMWLCWLGFLLGASLLHAVARRDDPQWETLFGGFARGRLGAAYALLALLLAALAVFAAANSHPVHGLMSLLVALLTALLLPVLSSGKRGRRAAPGKAAAEAASGTAPVAGGPGRPDTVAAEARPLSADDFPPFAPDALARRVVQAVAPGAAGAAGALIFREFEFARPSSDSTSPPPPVKFSLSLPPSAYLDELARPRPVGPADTASALADSSESPVVRRVAARLTEAAGSPGDRLHLILAFAASLPGAPVPEDGPRLPVQVLHDGAATAGERVWLSAALLQASGMRAALWHAPSGDEAVAVTDVYDAASGETGGAVLRVPGGPAWLLYRPGAPAPDPAQGRIYELKQPL